MLFSKGPRFLEDYVLKKWSGQRRLVVSLDIGTTHSAVSVAILTPGDLPHIVPVSRWPGQEHRMYEEKVPTVVLYNGVGEVVHCGAEALTRDVEDSAGAHGWTLVKNFKLRLHSKLTTEKSGLQVEEVLTLQKVYTDFMQYIMDHARRFVEEDQGQDPWLFATAEFIMAHPNNWGMYEQDFIAEAAISAGLIRRKDLKTHLYFVEEAEAAARYCVSNPTVFSHQFEKGSKFMVCDAGGATVDISAYEVTSLSKDWMELSELEVPSCVSAGGIQVDLALSDYLRGALAPRSPLETQSLVRDGVRYFESTVKRRFIPSSSDVSLQIAGRGYQAPTMMVENGIMKIKNKVIEAFFQIQISRIINAMHNQLKRPDVQDTRHIILTGGFGESPYVRRMIEREFGSEDCSVIIANSKSSKAVATGALMLAIGRGSVRMKRKERSFMTWTTNFDFVMLAKILLGIGQVVIAILGHHVSF